MFCNIKIRCGGPIFLGNARAQTFKVSEKNDLRNFICVSFFSSLMIKSLFVKRSHRCCLAVIRGRHEN